jgi:indole-3-glycerol phosphate synthase
MRNKGNSLKLNGKNFLEKIINIKKKDLQTSHDALSVRYFDVSDETENAFITIFKKKKNNASVLIAEVKFASPTNYHLGSSDDLLQRVKEYEQAGADAISVITEKHFFRGNTAFVSKIKKAVKLPVLQKDFVIDEKQIYEAKEIGSDALLLIARLVDKKILKEFVNLCLNLHIEPMVEINSEEDLKKAIATKTNIIAINARDLETFAVDVAKACELMKKIPDRFIKLGFSGIHSPKEVLQYKKAGAKGVLVGTSLMQAKDIVNFVNELMS